MTRSLAAVLLVALAAPARAADPPADTAALARVVRDLILQHMPTPLVETKHDWGRQREVSVGLNVRRDGPLRWQAEPRRAMRNDGHWYAVTVTVPDPKRSLAVAVRNVRPAGEGAVAFDAELAADVDLRFVQQLWRAGVRVYSGETRGRCGATLRLACEASTKFEANPGSFLPSATVRFRATAADLSYDRLLVEHTLGVGGDAARLMGDGAHALLTRVKPSLERDLLAKANAAIVKAADTRDIRVGLDKLIATK